LILSTISIKIKQAKFSYCEYAERRRNNSKSNRLKFFIDDLNISDNLLLVFARIKETD